MALRTQTDLTLHSGDRDLEKGFDLLKGEALRYVFEGYPVGDYYEAALPGRDAFCMRDVSHQCMGAQALGLGRHNFNMFLKFAQALSEKRDYCSYWEIDRYDRPCPVDYTSDTDFWYNLPANFDVVDAMYRMWRWSGDARYLWDDDISRFCALSMQEYVARWDRDGDGIPDRIPAEGRRGIASYDEGPASVKGLRIGTDLVLIMTRAYLSYSEMCRVKGLKEYARIYRRRYEALMADIRGRWFDPDKGLSFGMDLEGHILFPSRDPWREKELIYRGLGSAGEAATILDMLEKDPGRSQIIELFSHIPETLWRYGREEGALRALRIAMDETLPRREYPEASYAAIGAIVNGLMGVMPDAEFNRVSTLSGLSDVEWVALWHIGVLDGRVSVEHTGHERTELTNECEHPITWRACFPKAERICVNGQDMAAILETDPLSGRTICYADVTIGPKETAIAALK